MTSAAVDQPVDSSRFEFTPPADAEELPGGGYVGAVGGGSGWRVGSPGPGGSKGVRCSRSHRWAGGSFVEELRYEFRGHEIKFEQRWTLSEDESEIRITERIQGPKGSLEREVSIPVA